MLRHQSHHPSAKYLRTYEEILKVLIKPTVEITCHSRQKGRKKRKEEGREG